MEKLQSILQTDDIPPFYRKTPIGLLLEYHNLNRPFESYEKADLLIGMCMDNRKYLNIPKRFAYIIRTGGANLRYSEFHISYALAVGGIRHVALIGHDKCGMVGLASKKDSFINGLVNGAGWQRQWAEDYFNNFAPLYEIGNEVDFTLFEAKRLTARYSGINIVPMLYKIDDNLLYLIKEK
jgi:carbonic anhydrase